MKIAGSGAVVTGGASGIGRATVEELAARGARVVLADIDVTRARAVAGEIGQGVIAAAVDVRDHRSVEALAEAATAALGHVDIVFANAGVSLSAPVLDATPEGVDWVLSVNVRGVWSTLSVFGKRMSASGRPGHLCMTGSEHSLGMQHRGVGLYTASKHAVLGMADVLRTELPPSIGVSVLCPGLVSTDLHLSKRNSALPQDAPESLAVAAGLMAHGMPAHEIGRAVVAGVERGDFIIVTHAVAQLAAKRRYDEIAAAFAAQAPWTDDAGRYDVNAVAQIVMQELAARAAVAGKP